MTGHDLAAEAAWERYQEAIDEPPFDENHHHYHTPNQPLETCATCLYQGWAEDENHERDLFMAGWNAAKAEVDGE